MSQISTPASSTSPFPPVNPSLSLALGFLLMASLACAPAGEEPAPAPEAARIQSAELDLAVAAIPDGLRLVETADDSLVFAPIDESGEGGEGTAGTLRIELGPALAHAANLDQARDEHKARYVALPAGDYRGTLELGTPLGPAYSVRGWFDDDAGQPMEEFRLMMVHPAQNRIVHVVYLYPRGEAPETIKTRNEQAMALLGEIEAYGG